MAYGTPRAAKVTGNGLVCVPCVGDMIEEGELQVDPYAQTENVEKLLSRNQVKGIDDILVEGQYPDQRQLEEFNCHKCDTPLRKHCTDY